jgi:hypothetical protein
VQELLAYVLGTPGAPAGPGPRPPSDETAEELAEDLVHHARRLATAGVEPSLPWTAARAAERAGEVEQRVERTVEANQVLREAMDRYGFTEADLPKAFPPKR